MKKKTKALFFIFAGLTALFILYTAAIKYIDVGAIGPNGSRVGFSTLNQAAHSFFGVHMSLYSVTDWASLAVIAVMLGFAVLGLIMWIKRKSFLKVDYSILILGAYYILVFLVYIMFEFIVVNYRPVLINGVLEASYPSSTTMLVMCVIPTAVILCNRMLNNRILKNMLNGVSLAFMAFMVIGRAVSGVHWLTDIVGGIILSMALVMLYYACLKLADDKIGAK